MPVDKHQVLMLAVIKQLAKENLFRKLNWNAIADEIGAPHGNDALRRWNRFLQNLQGPQPKSSRVGVPKPQVPAPLSANQRNTEDENSEQDHGQEDDEKERGPENQNPSTIRRESEDDADIKGQPAEKHVNTEFRSIDGDKEDFDSEVDDVSTELDNLEVDSEGDSDWV